MNMAELFTGLTISDIDFENKKINVDHQLQRKNLEYVIEVTKISRERRQIPIITPHVCRHTFYSNIAKSGMNPKTLQYIMGHSEIGVTLNTYMYIGFVDASLKMKKQ